MVSARVPGYGPVQSWAPLGGSGDMQSRAVFLCLRPRTKGAESESFREEHYAVLRVDQETVQCAGLQTR